MDTIRGKPILSLTLTIRGTRSTVESGPVASSEVTFDEKPPVVAQSSKPTSRASQHVSPRDASQKRQPCDLPVELAALVFSHIEHVQTRQTLEAMSSTFQEASSLPGALPRTFDLEGVAGNLADQLVRLLDGDRVRSLEKERALELIGVHKDRLCEYACGRNFEVLKWAHNELDLPWAPYPAGRGRRRPRATRAT